MTHLLTSSTNGDSQGACVQSRSQAAGVSIRCISFEDFRLVSQNGGAGPDRQVELESGFMPPEGVKLGGAGIRGRVGGVIEEREDREGPRRGREKREHNKRPR